MLTQLENQMEISSQPENINLVEKLIEEIRDAYRINEDAYGNMLVAVTEAVTNAILHGNKANPQKKVNIRYECKDEQISFMISDEGNGFDHYNLPDPTAPENIEKVSGRGIFLMKHLADQTIFSNDGKTVELYFKVLNK